MVATEDVALLVDAVAGALVEAGSEDAPLATVEAVAGACCQTAW